MEKESMDGEETDIANLMSQPDAVERSFVQDVYDIIGSHFSETRYKVRKINIRESEMSVSCL
jgi:hypothetical protein